MAVSFLKGCALPPGLRSIAATQVWAMESDFVPKRTGWKGGRLNSKWRHLMNKPDLSRVTQVDTDRGSRVESMESCWDEIGRAHV